MISWSIFNFLLLLCLSCNLMAAAQEKSESGSSAGSESGSFVSNLLESTVRRDIQGIEDALAAGEQIDTTNINGWTAAAFAVADSSLDVLKVLIERGIDLNIANNKGYTPLMIAALQSDREAVEMLLEANADPSITNHDGVSAYSVAVESRRLVNVGLILDNLVLRGMMNNDPDMILTNIKNGGYINIRSPAGWNPLIYAVANKNIEMVENLLEWGANANHVENDGWSPLHFAAVNGYEDIVNMLILAGCDPHTTNLAGKTAKDLAAEQDHSAIVLALDEAV